jgi:ElaB/YqjD/DUF883 family membrane-anchored ribosome-binding protein
VNTFTYDGFWNKIRGKLRQKYVQFTDDDLVFLEGKGEACKDACERARTLRGKAENSVTQQPFKALLTASEAGFVIGFSSHARHDAIHR